MENNDISHSSCDTDSDYENGDLSAREILLGYLSIDNDLEIWMKIVLEYVKIEYVNIKKEILRLYFQLSLLTNGAESFNNTLARISVLKLKLTSVIVWKLLVRQKVNITRSVSVEEGLDNYCRGKEI